MNIVGALGGQNIYNIIIKKGNNSNLPKLIMPINQWWTNPIRARAFFSLIVRRREIEIQRQPISGPLLLPLLELHLINRDFFWNVRRRSADRPGATMLPHVPAEGLARTKLRPAIRALVDSRRRQRCGEGGGGHAAQLKRERVGRESVLGRRRRRKIFFVGKNGR